MDTIKFNEQVAQGDLLILKINSLPEGLVAEKPVDGKYIVAHSESGHNHAIKEREGVSLYSNDNDPLVAYLVVDNATCHVEHERDFDKHTTIEIGDGIYKIRRQREYIPEGWRIAQD